LIQTLGSPDFVSAEDLAKLRFFEGESPDAIEWLLGVCQRISIAAGEVLLEAEADNDKLFIIFSGTLSVRLTRSGEPISLLVRGDCAGEMSVLDRTHTSAWVVAHSPCELLILDTTQVWSLITRSHVVAVNLLCILSDRVRTDNRVIDKSRQLKDFYAHHARVDPLTGLNNRRWLDDSMARLARRSRADADPMSVLMLDVDHFKAFNDRFGHICGDQALRVVASTIQQLIRPGDVAARFGGEEFAILLLDTDIEAGIVLAERLREAVNAAPIHDSNDRPIEHITVSIGLACTSAGETSENLLEQADAALYRAKRAGRNRTCR